MHHFFKTFLIGFVPPWELSESKVTQQVQQRFYVILFQVLLVGQVGCQRCIHCGPYNSEIIIFLIQIFLKRLCCCFLFPCFWINYIFFFNFHHFSNTSFSLWSISRRFRNLTLNFCEAKVNKIDIICFWSVIANNNISRF